MSEQKYIFQELIDPIELGVPKTSAYFKKNDFDYFIKAADSRRGWQIKREIFFYKNIGPKLDLPKRIKLPDLVDFYTSDDFSYLVLRRIPEHFSLKFLEEDYSKDFITISDTFFSIKQSKPTSIKEQEKLLSMYKLYKKVFDKIGISKESLEKNCAVCDFNSENVLTHNDLNGNNVLSDGEFIYVVDCERWQFWNKIYEISRAANFSALHHSLKSDVLFPLETSYLNHYYLRMNDVEKQLLHLHLIFDSARRIYYYESKLKHDPFFKDVLDYSFELLNKYRYYLL